jgi:hypothetical protein
MCFATFQGSEQATTMFFPHFVGDAGSRDLVNTTPHPRRRGGQSVSNESRESPT